MKKMNRLFALAMALCLAFAMMTVASASNEATSSGGSATSQVTLSSTADGSLDGDPAATAMSVTAPTVLPIAVGTDGKVTTATDAEIVNNSYGAVKVSSVSIQAAQDWKLTAFGDPATLAGAKVDSNQVGFAMTIGDGQQLATVAGSTASQDLLTSAVEGCYMTGSGDQMGNRVAIDYPEFLKAHRRFYHPSNARIFLDGALQIEKILDILDREYFSGYTRIPSTSPVPLQTSVDAGTSVIRYELPEGETSAGRGRIAEAFVVGTYAERERLAALQALMNTICGDNEAPLKRRFLDSALAKDVNISLYTGVLQPWLSVDLRDVAEGREEEASAILWDELRCLSEAGLDHGRILAVLDNLEFQERQRDYGRTPQGIALVFQVMESWLYGGAPEANLSVGTLYENLRKKCTEGYFESLLKQTMIAVDVILIRLRLSLFRTHTTERIKPSRTKTILAPAQAVRTPSDSERCKNDGARAASGRMLTIPSVYLISFFSNWVTASAKNRPNTTIAHGRNGNIEKAVLEVSAVPSWVTATAPCFWEARRNPL